MKLGRGEVVGAGREGVEVEADDVSALIADMELVGGKGGEYPGRLVKRGVLNGGVNTLSGNGNLGAVGDEAGGAAVCVREEDAVVMERSGGAGAAVNEVVVGWKVVTRG